MMTRKQINSLRRKARMGAVIGAAIYLAVGVTSFGKDNSSIEASATPTQQPVSIPQETSKATVQEERIITYTWFRLVSGFTKELYMSKNEVTNHAKKYSQSYRYDLNDNKTSSKWSTDFDAMAKKTVIKLLLSKWGILSVEMQRAIADDQKTFDEEGNEEYGDNQPDVIEAEDPFTQIEDKSGEQDDEPEELDITQ